MVDRPPPNAARLLCQARLRLVPNLAALVLLVPLSCIHDYELTEGGDGGQGGAGGGGVEPTPSTSVPWPPPLRCAIAPESPPGAPQWLLQAGDDQDQAIRDLVVDSQANAVVVGDFRGTIDFGLGPLTSVGGFDQFVAKVDCAGKPQLAMRFGSSTNQELFTRLAIDRDDNIIIAGELVGIFDFGGGDPISSDDGDAFVAKLSPTGELLWQRTFGGPNRQLARAVAVDNAGRVLVAGYFRGTMAVGFSELTSVDSDYDAFLVRLDSDGEPLEHRVFGSPSEEFIEAMAVSDDGMIALTGVIQDTDVGTSFGGPPLVSAGGDDAFVAVFDDQLEPVWSAGFGSADPDNLHFQLGKRVVFQGDELVVMARVSGSIDFGGGPLAPAPFGIALGRFDARGGYLASKAFDNVAFAHGLAAFANGDIAIGGEALGALDLGGRLLPSFGGTDLFFARLDHDFEHVWSRSYGGSGDDQIFALAIDARGGLFVGGNFRNTLTLDDRMLESAGDADLLIARTAP